ncbi:MAG: hypothetical protein ACLFT0_19600 [Spirulinaceae cyanobacterium]
MTNSQPPSPRKPILDFDEWVAVIVSFGAIALILALGLARSDKLLDSNKIPELGLPTKETDTQLPTLFEP